MICCRAVSSPTFVAAKRNDPLVFMVAPITSSPSRLVTGMDSPVIIDSSTADSPERTRPSTGIFSPGLTTTTSPICTSSTGTSTSSPPRTTRAVFACSPASFFMASLVRPFARASSRRPSRIRVMMSAEVSKYTSALPAAKSPGASGGHRAVEVGGAGAHDHQRVHVGLPVLERAPRPPVESPPGPELHRRGEDEQPQVQPGHRHGGHEAEHHRQAADEDERRERGSEEEVGFELAVLALVRAFYGSTLILPHDTVAGPLDGLLQISRFDLAREVA